MHLQSCMSGVITGLLFGVSMLSAQHIVDMPYKEVTVKNIDGSAVFYGGDIAGEVGQPALPAYTVSVLLPPDADISGVKVTLDGATEKILAGTYEVAPIAGPPNFKVTDGRTVTDGKDIDIYGNDRFFPADYAGDVSFGMKWQYKLVHVTIRPYAYNPVTKELRMLTGGSLKISLGKGTGTTVSDFANRPRNADDEQFLKSIIDNPDELDSYGSSPSSALFAPAPPAPAAMAAATPKSLAGRVFAVFVTNSLYSASAELRDYLSSIGARYGQVIEIFTSFGTGPTAALAIRAKLIDLINNGNAITDVLFIGNPDPDVGEVPMYKYNSIPTDWYYSDLSSSFPDRSAELRVGRIPIYNNNTANLNKIMTKTLTYISETDVEWRRYALLPAVPLDFADQYEAATIMNEMHTTLSSDGWGTYRIIDSYSWMVRNHIDDISKMVTPADEYYCNYSTVPPVWNRLDPGLVLWSTHGFERWATDILISGPAQPGWGTDLLDDSKPAAVMAMSCETANPNDVENLGMNTLLSNAIVYIGATYGISMNDMKPIATRYIDRLKNDPAKDYIQAFNEAKTAATTISMNSICGFVFYGCTDVCLNLTELSSATTVLPAPELVSVEADVATTPETSIKITWTPVTGQGVTGYGIEYGSTGTTRADGFQFLADVNGENADVFVHNGRTMGTKYYYRVYAKDAAGRSGYSRMDSASTFLSGNLDPRPGTSPAFLPITASVNCNTPRWNAVTNADYYVVFRSFNGSPFVFLGNTTDLYFNDRNVINGETYDYKVAAVNSFGIGPVSGTSVSSQAPAVVQAPAITNVSMANANTMVTTRVEWQNNPNGTFGLGSDLEYCRSLPENNWTDYSKINRLRYHRSGNIDAFNHGLEGNVDYKFRVKTMTYDKYDNLVVSGPSSEITFRPSNSSYTPPPTPSMVSAVPTPGVNESVTVTWSSGGTPDPEGYAIFKTNKNGDWEYYDLFESTASTMSMDFEIGANVYCKFAVQAYDVDTIDDVEEKIFSEYSLIADVTADPKLSTPFMYTIPTEITHNSIMVRISYPSGGSAQSFTFYRSTDNINFTPLPVTTEWFYTDLNRTPSTTYYYKVVAHAPGCTDSDESFALPVTTLPAPPLIEFFMADQTLSSNQQSQIRFAIGNQAGGASLSGFTVRYFFTAENGKTPEVGDYWTPYCDVTLENRYGDEWCVALTFNGTLPPGGRIPEYDGQLIGLHYTDWSAAWDKSNDFSQPAGSSVTLSDKVAVYDNSNNLIYGMEP